MKKLKLVTITGVLLVVGIIALDYNNNRIEHINDQLANNPSAAGNQQKFGSVNSARNSSNGATAGFKTSTSTTSVYKVTKGNVTSYSDVPSRTVVAANDNAEIIEIKTPTPPTTENPSDDQQIKHSKWENQFAMFPQDKNGWSIITPSVDSRLIYVSSTDGDDIKAKAYFSKDIPDPHNPPVSMVAFKTIAAALKLQRSGHSDWILLKKGDEWTSGTWYLNSGRSTEEPLVITSYGEYGKRPLVQTGIKSAVFLKKGKSYISIIGIEFIADQRDPKAKEFAGWNNVGSAAGFLSVVDSNQPSTDITLEDNVFNYYGGAIVFTGTGEQNNIVVRRNQLLNSYSSSGHSQGLFTYKTKMLLEENLIDHNGWYQSNYEKLNSQEKGQATWFNHNIYMSRAVDTLIVDNIITRASSIGVKLSANGGAESTKNSIFAENVQIIGNLFAEGEIGISAGGNQDFDDGYRFKNMTIKNNVMIHLGDSQPLRRTFAMGIQTVDWDGGEVSNNYLLYSDNLKLDNIHGIDITELAKNVNVSNNILKGFRAPKGNEVIKYGNEKIVNLEINNNVVFDTVNRGARHDLASYFGTGGSGNAVSILVEKAKTQSKSKWNKAYTASEINKYLMD